MDISGLGSKSWAIYDDLLASCVSGASEKDMSDRNLSFDKQEKLIFKFLPKFNTWTFLEKWAACLALGP